MSGGLVVESQSSVSWHTALGPVDSFASSAEAAGRGDWVEAGLNGAAGGLETLGAIADPAGALISAGVGWLIEHLGPLKSMLDGLAGDPDQIHAFASTWHNVSTRVHDNADDLRSAVGRAVSDWSGPAISAYQAAVHAQAAVLDGFGTMITGVAGTVEVAGVIVGSVRALVRDAISQVVGYGLSKVAQLLSVVLAPKAIGEFVAKVAEWAARVSGFVKRLIASMGKLGELLGTLHGHLGTGHAKMVEIGEAYNAAPKRVPFAIEGAKQTTALDDRPN